MRPFPKVLRYNPKIPSCYKEDIEELEDVLIQHNFFFSDPFEGFLAWTDFSSYYSAGWLYPNDETIANFIEWLNDQ